MVWPPTVSNDFEVRMAPPLLHIVFGTGEEVVGDNDLEEEEEGKAI